jgi:hypothetical protein
MMSFVLGLTLFGFNLKLVEQNSISAQSFRTSLAGNYAYQVECTPHGVGETPIASFSLFDRSHQLLTSLHAPGVEMMFVSDEGWFVGALNSATKVKLSFYDRGGDIRARTETDAPANYAFSNSGTYFYVSNALGVQAFDADGRVVAQFAGGAWFKPSDDDRFMAVVAGDRVEVHAFSRKTPVAAFRLGSLLFRDLAFSPNGEYLAVAERSAISLYALSEPNPVWKQPLDPTMSLLNLAVNDQGRVYTAGEIARQGFLIVIENGRELTRCSINYSDDHETINAVEAGRGTIQVSTTFHQFRFEEGE